MQYSVGVEYALHSLVYLCSTSKVGPIGIKDLAKIQGLSETYLSKIFTKLVKADIITSSTGVKGGYVLTQRPENITFWDVVRAIEGEKPLFQCRRIVDKNIFNEPCNEGECSADIPCRINLTMLEAENKMRDYLKSKTLLWLKDTLDQELPTETIEKTAEWFDEHIKP
ncbi:Rrf2 family transcriptional regulator [Cytobacillus sp. IB215665]|uniref:RrF2 family transcriptional regulator n=1 Tax=Cytobacillus sp. IB215665 TaxID=3097357 RepID=UPI002A0ED927|nr:Rrf2 family transcriptional regulator [Cytobacillus sp. IB215665]MDX8366023.1 Rrf2 family transcriptional regulator [Cytobacillus sp. IB215665]